MQRPSRLRNKPEHKPLTYSQILSHHRPEQHVKSAEKTADEICKIYGTRRAPGVYQGYVKSSPRTVKTYQEICRATRPVQSQAVSKLHNLVPKVQSTKAIKMLNSQQRRYKPYDPNVTAADGDYKIEDMSDWSLDENMKEILYGKSRPIAAAVKLAAGKRRKGASVKHEKECDEDTLADIDGDHLLRELLEDERRNEKMYQSALKDLSNLEGYGNEDDYVSQVNLEDLENLSLENSGSAISSFIDWDQIDQIIGMTS